MKHPLDKALENIEHIRKTNPDRFNRIINRCWDRYASEIISRIPPMKRWGVARPVKKKPIDANPLSERITK